MRTLIVLLPAIALVACSTGPAWANDERVLTMGHGPTGQDAQISDSIAGDAELSEKSGSGKSTVGPQGQGGDQDKVNKPKVVGAVCILPCCQ